MSGGRNAARRGGTSNQPAEGISRRDPRSRYWVFTFNNYGEDDERRIVELVEGGDATYLIVGHEIGDSGTPHLQGYIEFAIPKGFTFARNELGGPRVHIEIRRGSGLAAASYCKKGGDFKEYGTLRKSCKGDRRDLREIQDLIESGCSELDIARHYPGQWHRYYRSFDRYRLLCRSTGLRDVQVYVLWGDPGTGKSGFVYDFTMRKYGCYNSLYSVADAKNWWFDGYARQPVVLFDDFRGESTVSNILRITDRYPVLAPVKGGFVDFTPEYVFFTSNKPPEEWFPDSVDVRAFRRRVRRVVRCSDAGFGVSEWESYYAAILGMLGLERDGRGEVLEEEKTEE